MVFSPTCLTMNILFKRKVFFVINNVPELEIFLNYNKIYNYFKKIHHEFYEKIQFGIDGTDSINYKQIKPWLRSLLNYPESIYNPQFLWCMGWELNDINYFISELQKKNSKKLLQLKIQTPEKYSALTTNQIGYWLDKGYSIDDAKTKVSERQNTFSKEKCIKKYGEVEGLIKFEERQIKWIDSLKKKEDYREIQKKKNPYNYLLKPTIEIVRRSSFIETTKNNIINNLNRNNIDDFTKSIISSIDLKNYSELQPYINSKIIQEHFNVNRDEIKCSFIKQLIFNPFESKYGTFIYYKNNRFKSLKEYSLALFLESRNVDFLYEINYPNSNRKCDFYLPQQDLYIEYFGMLDGKKIIKENSVFEFYKNKMDEKIIFCEQNNISLIFDKNYENLIKKLKLYL